MPMRMRKLRVDFYKINANLSVGGPAQKKWIFQMIPKSILSCLIYSTRCEYDILKVL